MPSAKEQRKVDNRISLLKKQFPNLSEAMLREALDACNNNLREAIQMLNELKSDGSRA